MNIFALVEPFWDPANKIRVLAAAAGMIVAIAVTDWWTRIYVSLGFLYLFPIMLAAGFLPRLALVALGILCAVLSEMFSSLNPAWNVSRLILQALALAGCGLFVSELLRARRLNLETHGRLRALIETSPAAIVMADECGLIELANQSAAELMSPTGGNLIGQPIARFLPELENALKPGGEARFRASMQCEVHRSDGERFVAEVWFSTYKQTGTPKLAAIVADVTEELPAGLPSHSVESNGAKRPALSNRQIAVLQLVFEGLSNHEIASRLDMTSSAVKNTLQQLFSKAGVNNRSQMVRVALEQYRDLL